MKEISLTQGKFAIVDDADYEWLSQWKWQVYRDPGGRLWYALRSVREAGKKRHLRMHAVIMGSPASPNLTVDHRDLNGLNNQRANLRWATPSQQQQNTPAHSLREIGFKGINFRSDQRKSRPWQVRISVANQRIHLGYFETRDLAAQAYNSAALKHFGEFARLNPV